MAVENHNGMNHQGYDNHVIANKLEDILNTKLDVNNLMTIDRDLVENAGMKKYINTYKYEGTVEELSMGQGNANEGLVTMVAREFEVKLRQQKFAYYDEQMMKDPLIVDAGTKGAAVTMVNDLNSKFFDCLEEKGVDEKVVVEHQIAGAALVYDDVIDALGKMNMEMEEGLFLVVGDDMKNDIRKDEDFKRARQGELLFAGQVGQIAGLPIVHSKLVAPGHAYVMDKSAVTCFVKKEAEVEQERDADVRLNKIFYRLVNVLAITDATRIVRIKKA